MGNSKEEYKKRFPWLISYYSAKYRCNNPNHISYKKYGGKGIKMLMIKEDFKELWFRDKAYLMKKPSIDRINSNKNYIIKNCRYVEHYENSTRGCKPRPILQFSKDNKFIKRWESVSQATNKGGFHRANLNSCLSGKYKATEGYIFRYECEI